MKRPYSVLDERDVARSDWDEEAARELDEALAPLRGRRVSDQKLQEIADRVMLLITSQQQPRGQA